MTDIQSSHSSVSGQLDVNHENGVTLEIRLTPYEAAVPRAESLQWFKQGDEVYQLPPGKSPIGPYTVMHDVADNLVLVDINCNLFLGRCLSYNTNKEWYFASDFEDGKLKTHANPRKKVKDLWAGEYFEYNGQIYYMTASNPPGFALGKLSLQLAKADWPTQCLEVQPLGTINIRSTSPSITK